MSYLNAIESKNMKEYILQTRSRIYYNILWFSLSLIIKNTVSTA